MFVSTSNLCVAEITDEARLSLGDFTVPPLYFKGPTSSHRWSGSQCLISLIEGGDAKTRSFIMWSTICPGSCGHVTFRHYPCCLLKARRLRLGMEGWLGAQVGELWRGPGFPNGHTDAHPQNRNNASKPMWHLCDTETQLRGYRAWGADGNFTETKSLLPSHGHSLRPQKHSLVSVGPVSIPIHPLGVAPLYTVQEVQQSAFCIPEKLK